MLEDRINCRLFTYNLNYTSHNLNCTVYNTNDCPIVTGPGY